MEVASSRTRGGGRGWVFASTFVAVLVAGPLLALPASFLGEGDAFDAIATSLLPEALLASLVLAAGVAVGTLLVGGGLAALVSFYDFPGRRWLDWALVLPLAVPGYVLVFVLLGQYDEASALQRAVRSVLGVGLPDIRTTAGTITILTLVLYPYVYTLGRSAFLGQSRQSLEAARTLGLSYGRRCAGSRFPSPVPRSAPAWRSQ